MEEAIADSVFALPELNEIDPAPLEPLDETYTEHFINAMDGSNGSLSVRWGKIGPDARSSSGLN